MAAITATVTEVISRASSATSSTTAPRVRSRRESPADPKTPLAVSLIPSTAVKVKSEPPDEDEAVDSSKFANSFFSSVMQPEEKQPAESGNDTREVRKRPPSMEPGPSTSKKIHRPMSPAQMAMPSSSMPRFQPSQSSLPGPSRTPISSAAGQMKPQPFSGAIPPQRRKLQPPPLWDMIVRFPDELALNSEKFNAVMKSWKSVAIDEITVPVITRPSGIKIIPITVVQTKLYAQFAHNVVSNMMKTTNPLRSYFLEPIEAWMYNAINSTVFNHSLGLKVFQSKEECVDIREVEFQYWQIKKFHLEQIFAIYSNDVPPGTHLKRNVTGTLVKLKGDTYKTIKRIEDILKLKAALPYKFPH